jgi:hypothetical protein
MKSVSRKRRMVEIEEVICNKCGKSMMRDCCGEREIYGLCTEVSGGYGSSPLEDMTKYLFDLCEDCLLDLFESFSIPVTKKKLY